MQCHIGIEKITFSSQCSKLYNAPTRNDYSKVGATRKRLFPQENGYKKQTDSEATPSQILCKLQIAY